MASGPFHLAILERNGFYAAGVFTPRGIYCTSVPRASQTEAVRAVHGQGLPVSQEGRHISILARVLDMYEGLPSDSLDAEEFDFSGITQKEASVLRALLRVPYGQTVTYGHLASAAGIPRGARFVGNVMARNRFAPLIPCHRVLSSSGLGGYSLGIDIKTHILRLEGAIAD